MWLFGRNVPCLVYTWLRPFGQMQYERRMQERSARDTSNEEWLFIFEKKIGNVYYNMGLCISGVRHPTTLHESVSIVTRCFPKPWATWTPILQIPKSFIRPWRRAEAAIYPLLPSNANHPFFSHELNPSNSVNFAKFPKRLPSMFRPTARIPWSL